VSFSPGTTVSYTNEADRHNITKILLKVALNTITNKPIQGSVEEMSTSLKVNENSYHINMHRLFLATCGDLSHNLSVDYSRYDLTSSGSTGNAGECFKVF
jgi:hypothetical protein